MNCQPEEPPWIIWGITLAEHSHLTAWGWLAFWLLILLAGLIIVPSLTWLGNKLP